MKLGWRSLEIVAVVTLLSSGAFVRVHLTNHPRWVFAGSDSYGYLKLGNELWSHGRFSLGPSEPLEWYRRPLYPLFLRAARRAAPTEMSGGEGWKRIQLAQAFVDLLAALVLYLAARQLAGRLAAFVALSLALFYPPSAIWFAAVLTECLSMALTIMAIAPIFWLRERPRLAAALTGVAVGLASLLRPDGPLLAVAIVPALAWLPTWSARARVAVTAAVAFLAVFAIWPIRNVVQFGKPHLTDGMIDRHGHDVPNFVGFWRWMQSWSLNSHPAEYPQSCFYDAPCQPTIELFPPVDGAFVPADTPNERQRVDALLQERRRRGVTAEVSNGFLAIARERRQRHPLRTLVQLPLERAWTMWTSSQDELLKNPGWRPWIWLTNQVLPYFPRFARWLVYLTLLGGATVLLDRRLRIPALVILLPILTRTLVLGWTAFSLPRYIVGLYPLCFLIIGCATAVVAEWLARGLRSALKAARDRR